MKDQSQMFGPEMWPDSDNVTGSPELQSGVTPCDSQDGQTAAQCGQAPAPARLSAHDDTHTPAEWAEFIRKFAGRAEYQGQFQDNAEAIARYQKCMIDVAGLAISAVLSSQRKVCGESA